jgi:uncharacterized protein
MKKKCKCEEDVKQLVGLVLAIFLLSLTVLSVVVIVNQVKASKYIGRDNVQRNSISVSGLGEVTAVPDLGTITFSVITEADTADEATNENAEKMNAIIEVVKSFEIDETDIKTLNYSVRPRYDYDEKGLYYYGDGDRELIGYEVSQSLQVKIRDIDDSGEIIKAATEAGADQVGGLQFTIDDEDDLKLEARELAIEDAKEKAKLLANQLGVKLVKVMYFSENSYPYYSMIRSDMAMDMEAGSKAVTPTIEPGENTVKVNVSITYEIN